MAILDSLRRRRIARICHMTSCDRLPEIFAHGGLLSYRQRRERGIPESEHAHFWGSPGKKEQLEDYVISSFMPPWWMCRGHDEELAIVLLDAERHCTRTDARFCPVNSAKNDYSAADIHERGGLAAFDDCFESEVTYQAGNAEIFVSGVVPLTDFRAIIFPDEDARTYWIARINATEYAVDPEPELPDEPITTHLGGTQGFHFPGDYKPTRRVRGDA